MMAGHPLRCLVLLSVALHLCAAHAEVHPFTHLRHKRAEADLPTQRIENPGQNHKFPWILLPFPGHYSFQYYNNNFFSFQKFIRDAYSILILSHGEYKT